MIRLYQESNKLMEMTNIRGKNIRTDNVSFSIYYSTKADNPHSIRVKVVWNREKMSTLDSSNSGYFELHGDYEYSGVAVSQRKENEAREFFKKYKILFSAVWEDVLGADMFSDYLRKQATFEDMLDDIDLVGNNKDLLLSEFDRIKSDKSKYSNLDEQVRNLKILEEIVRAYKLFKTND